MIYVSYNPAELPNAVVFYIKYHDTYDMALDNPNEIYLSTNCDIKMSFSYSKGGFVN